MIRILLPMITYPDGNSTRIAAHAANIAKTLNARIDAFVLTASFPNVSNALGELLVDIPALLAEVRAQGRDRSRNLLETLMARTSKLGIAVTSEEVSCHPAMFGEKVAERARYADLVVCALNKQDEALKDAATAAIFGSGKPVLLVPEEGDLGELSKVMIAWDGSRVAARAVADAIPFLVQAKQVVIAEVADEKLLPDQQASERLLKYLNERDVNASTVTLDLAGRSISECLQSEALALHIELLVMGGFGHSRVRDFILGGATKGLIADIQIPTLMSH